MVGTPDPDPVTTATPQPGDLLPQAWHRKMTFNVSAGLDAVLFDVIPFRVGLFTNMSAAPDVPLAGDVLGVDDVDMFGASLSVGVRSGDYDIAIGASALLGSGHGYAILPAGSPSTYGRTEVQDRILYFFLSGAQRAAHNLARTAYREISEELRNETPTPPPATPPAEAPPPPPPPGAPAVNTETPPPVTAPLEGT
jgi:hypothetical protein